MASKFFSRPKNDEEEGDTPRAREYVFAKGASDGESTQFFIDQQTFVPLKTEVTEQNKGTEMEVAVPVPQHVTQITVVWKNEDSWDQDM